MKEKLFDRIPRNLESEEEHSSRFSTTFQLYYYLRFDYISGPDNCSCLMLSVQIKENN